MDHSEVLFVKQGKEKHEAELRKKDTSEMGKKMLSNSWALNDKELLSNPSYSFLERDGEALFDSIEENGGNEWVSLKITERKTVKTNLNQQAKELDKAQKELAEKERKLKTAESLAYFQRLQTDDHSSAGLEDEKELLNMKLDVIKAQREMDLKRAKTESERLRVELNVADAEVHAREVFLHMIPLDHPLRRKAVKSREKAMEKRRWAKWKVKLLSLNGRELEHEKTQLSHKQWEAMAQSVKSRDDKNCREDAILKVNIQGQDLTLINMGKAYMGGSKISYIFQDPKTKKQYLYKKAENCIGFANPKGAVMTKLGADFQNWLDKEHAIPATSVQNSQGEYIGSIQEIVDLKQENTVNFEKWQQQAEDKRDPSVLTDPVKDQLLRFHLIDWLLCNFDTKGENLLQRSDGQFVSIDKEGALTHIRKEGAQKMSVTYTPHTDEPIYNIFFRMYRDKKIDNLPLDTLDRLITEVENKSDDEYMAMFEPYFQTLKKHKRSNRALILKRKKELRSSYVNFLNELRPEERPGDQLKKEKGMSDWEIV